MKGNVKKVISGLLSVVTVFSAFIQPSPVHARDLEPAAYETEYPALEKVRAGLDEEEIVTAEDYMVDIGSDFDVEHDFSGIKFSSDKVKITFHEAKSKAGQKFDSNRADTYEAVYFVEPVSKNPSYHICRHITVKEKASVSSSGKWVADETENGLTVDSAIMQAEEQGIDLMSMEAGESVTFYASAGARSTERVTVTRGACYKYSDYGYGTYQTYKYTVKFDDVSATAYCIQPSKGSPDSGSYSITRLKDQKGLAKVCYYGTKASGDEGFFAEKYPDFSAGQRFILVHMAASHANGSRKIFPEREVGV